MARDLPDLISISVVVPFYNVERYVGTCLEALLTQKFPCTDYEIIMVNNNSTDASAEIVQHYPGVKLLDEPKQGSYAARNRGIKQAKGGIIAFTDPDCVPKQNWLRQISVAMANPEVAIILGNYELARETFALAMLSAYEHEKRSYVFKSKIRELYFGYTNNMAVRKSLFRQVGPFVERARGSDTIFVRRCVNQYSCDLVRYCPEVTVRHLEINCVRKQYQKYFTYGRSRQKYKNIVYARSLTNGERVRVFLNAVKDQRYSPMKMVCLFVLLALGFVCWLSGSLSAMLQRKTTCKPVVG